MENWKDLKLNSEKMILELTERRKKIEKELEENQKNPEKIAINKGLKVKVNAEGSPIGQVTDLTSAGNDLLEIELLVLLKQ